jgi:PBP1b-binding outer membrane lipoprotein LpoB
MKMTKNIFFLILLLLFFSNCSTLKDGFESQRKNSTDEFLVEKKKPLVMPPDFVKLPVPKKNKNMDNGEIEELINKNKNQNISTNGDKKNKTTETFILEKIKKN